MEARRKSILIIMIIILAGQLLGEIRSVAGELLIPNAKGERNSYKGFITITQSEILIECQEKLFSPFNESGTPKQSKLRIDTTEVERISINGNGIIIFPKDILYNRHRNLLNHVRILSLFNHQERLVFIFAIDMDKYNEAGDRELEVVKKINQRNDPNCISCGDIMLY